MKKKIAVALMFGVSSVAHAEYTMIRVTVFGMDCAPCAHAIRVSMKGIRGVSDVDVDLNTGLVSIKLTPGNAAEIRQVEEAVEKNGFTHKDATVTVRGTVSGTAAAPVIHVSGTSDRYALVNSGKAADISALIGKSVEVQGLLPQAGKGKIPSTLRYDSVTEVR
jgi:copper chaperone CopZ